MFRLNNSINLSRMAAMGSRMCGQFLRHCETNLMADSGAGPGCLEGGGGLRVLALKGPYYFPI